MLNPLPATVAALIGRGSPIALPEVTPAFLLSVAPLFALLAWAAVVDWRTRKIPNWLTFGLLGGGILRALLLPLADVVAVDFHVGDALLGCAAGFLLGVPLFAIGARGAGDAKLYIACGAWLGWGGVLVVFALEAVVGLVMVVAQCAAQRKLGELFRNAGVLVLSVLFIRRIGVAQARANGAQFTSIDRKLPHAVPFLVAAVLAVFASVL